MTSFAFVLGWRIFPRGRAKISKTEITEADTLEGEEAAGAV